jgi:hypothetical protein
LCKQNHLTTGWQLSWIFEVCLFGPITMLINLRENLFSLLFKSKH